MAMAPARLPRIGFVGLGNMGLPMAARLARRGFPMRVFDSRPDAVADFVDRFGGEGAASLGATGSASDIVIAMLPNGRIVRRAVLGEDGERQDGLADGMAAGTVLIDMGSSAPAGTVALGALLADRGVAMLDAPVSGGVKRAESGELAIMVGGDPDTVDRCRDVLGAMGSRLFETGPLGSAQAMKALNNLLSAAGFVAGIEVLMIGRRYGLRPETMIEILNASTGRNNSTEHKFAQFVLSRTFNSGFSLDLMVKDLTTALDLARETETPVPFGALCRELWAAARRSLEEGADHTAMARWVEAQAGTALADGEGQDG